MDSALGRSRSAEALVRAFTRVQPAPFVPEFRLFLADQLIPLWQATEQRAAAPQAPPFWAFAWPGSQALARYLLAEPALVRGKRVLDFGSGGGLAAIAAAALGADSVLACDLDPLASLAQRLNAELNDVSFETTCADQLDQAPAELAVDVVLAGDVCYERAAAERILHWLRRLAAAGTVVLLADPGRSYAPTDHLEPLVTYDVPTLRELESTGNKRTHLWRIRATAHQGLSYSHSVEEGRRTLRDMAAVATDTQTFSGFPDEAIQFLLELQAEQSRAWFKDHQADYVRLCRRPLELFVEELRERLLDIYPGMLEAEPHYFRIQRDTRFARDKTPYKTNLAADLAIRSRRPGEEEHGIPGLYFSYGLEGEYLGVGAWHMSPTTLAAYRQMLDHAERGAQVQRMVDELLGQGFTIEAMEKLKRVPPPYAPDHPRAELLKHKGFAVMAQPQANISSSRLLLDWAEAQVRASAPLMHLLDVERL